jgi:epoxyqueuosine reductase QueG
MMTRNLTDEISTLALKTGAELVGFTLAENLEREAPVGHKPSDLLKNAKSVVMLASGRSLNEDREYIYNWGPDFSLTYIRLKDEVKYRRKQARGCIDAVKNLLQQKGFNVVTEPHGWSGILSFKMAAYLAGLGVFGKGSFVVHPKLGPLNVLACILTDAQLECGKPLKMDVCKNCIECVKACKYGAFKKESDNHRWLGEKCRCYDLIMNPVTLKWTYGPCNSKCVTACPIGA